MNTGMLQKRWSQYRPAVYDKKERLVRLCIAPAMGRNQEDEEVKGYEYYEIQIDNHIDYGHIKSQLIEAAYAQKDEFGLLMNAMDSVVNALVSSASFASLKEAIKSEDIQKFADFTEYRKVCAEAAKQVMNFY